jgi:arylsulfatase A-like enzyme
MHLERMKKIAFVVLCVGIVAGFSFKMRETEYQRPNIILILADDLGKHEIGVYGGIYVPTPNIDRIALNGCLFTEGYASAAICAPSRAGLLTGSYQQRFGFEFQPHKKYPRSFFIRTFYKMFMRKENAWEFERASPLPSRQEVRQEGIPTDRNTIAELLKAEGYATGIIGKWHLGYYAPNLPNHRGFDYFFGFTEAFSLYAPEKNKEVVNAKTKEFTDRHIWNQGRSRHCAIRQNDKVVEADEYLTYRLAAEANLFMEQHRDEPFFLYVPFSAPHTPYQAPKKIYDTLTHIHDHNKRVYYAMIAALDEAVGSILDKVKDLGIEENTLIIFASDNGAATYLNVPDSAPLKGGKFTLFEGGINIPLMMQWKNRIAPQTVVHHPVSLLDIFPTVAAAALLSIPDETKPDGVNLLPYLSGKQLSAPHEALFWRSGYNRAIRKGNWKMIVDDRHFVLHLYDLANDKSEIKNLREQYPAIIDELFDELERWDSEMEKPRWPFVMNYRVIINGEEFRYAI